METVRRELAFLLLAVAIVSAFVAFGLAPPSSGSAAASFATSPIGGSPPAIAHSIVPVGPSPSSVLVGLPVHLAWQAVDTGGLRVAGFAVGCSLTVVVAATGSPARAWVNSSATGPSSRAANGTFSIPSAAWNGGELNVTVAPGSASSLSVELFGAALPSRPASVNFTVAPDLDHVELYAPTYAVDTFSNNGSTSGGVRTNDTYWHVVDHYGDMVPGAPLRVEVSAGALESQQVVRVTMANGTSTGAWVNYSVPAADNGTFRVLDGANTTLIGPVEVAAVVVVSTAPTSSLSWLDLLAVGAVAIAGVGGILVLALGGRRRASGAAIESEEELRGLAEGRATVVELLRRSGPMSLKEVETAWTPPPAPPALADWLASLVTDGTLSAEIGEGGQARFAVLERPVEEPKVTFDEAALEREIARRDRAAEAPDAETEPHDE